VKALRLQQNDKIGIISPFNPITADLIPQLNKGIDLLKSLGFEVVIARNALANTLGFSATPEEKADDINTMFKDSSIKAILFLESYGFSPEECYCNLMQLEQLGVFQKVKGIIVGYIYDEHSKTRAIHFEDLLARVTAKYRLPILKVNDFGHNCPNTVLPIGAKVKFNTDEKTIEIIEECIRFN